MLVLLSRDSPLNGIRFENILTLSRMGGVMTLLYLRSVIALGDPFGPDSSVASIRRAILRLFCEFYIQATRAHLSDSAIGRIGRVFSDRDLHTPSG